MTAPSAFAKLPKTNEALADLLIARNLQADKQETIHLLNSIGYYRLSGYLIPFKVIGSECFQDGTTLQTVWNIYTFDRHLRLLAMDALARIEIAIRALIVRHHTAITPDPFAYTHQANLPKLTKTQHTALLLSATPFVLRGMGVPDNWETLDLWKQQQNASPSSNATTHTKSASNDSSAAQDDSPIV